MNNTISIKKVREHDVYARDWTFVETAEGWIVKFGDTTLVTEHAKHPRVFTNLTNAVSRLKTELGVTAFRVEARKEAALQKQAA